MVKKLQLNLYCEKLLFYVHFNIYIIGFSSQNCFKLGLHVSRNISRPRADINVLAAGGNLSVCSITATLASLR